RKTVQSACSASSYCNVVWAHVDAFLGDTVRVICRVRPEILRTSKQLTWATALSFDSIEQLLDALVEQFVYEFGWKSLLERLQSLSEKLGVDVTVPDHEAKLLKLFEQRRHLIIHSGGVATKKYIEETGDTRGRVGKTILITHEDVRLLGDTLSMLCSDVFRAVAIKYLDAREQDLTQVLYRVQ